MTDGQGGRGVCEEELSRCEATRRRKARIKSVSSDPRELQDSRGESQLHKVFQLRRDRLCQFYVYRVVWVCARVCVSALGSERFLDPLNGRKKTIWIDDTSCAPLMFRQHRFPSFARDLGGWCKPVTVYTRRQRSVRHPSRARQKGLGYRTQP